MEEFDLGNLDIDDINAAIKGLQVDVDLPETEVPTDTTQQPAQVQPASTEVPQNTEDKGGLFGTGIGNFGDKGFIYGGNPVDFYSKDGQFGQRMSAPGQGLIDTVTDAINLIPKVNIPKAPTYEENATQALRNISGLVLPALALRGKLLAWGAKTHASGTAAPWLQKLGNMPSFAWFSRAGADIGTAGMVDLVAKQNEENQTLGATLQEFWPKLFQWLPESVVSDKDDSPGGYSDRISIPLGCIKKIINLDICEQTTTNQIF